MGRASTLSLHERRQIKVLSTTGYTVKRSANVVKRYRKAIMNFLRHQEEYDTKKSSERPSKLNNREKGKFCGLRRITRPASLKSAGFVVLMFKNYGVENSGQASQYCSATDTGLPRTYTSAQGRKTLLGQNIHKMRLGKDTTFMSLPK
uniref:HTH_Tnp_Tc3_1 domain-containing protein n=1 Tax=Heterorhabditis bacteriophora TaxID=37862 RepID=A0A1I7XDH1_HETBA